MSQDGLANPDSYRSEPIDGYEAGRSASLDRVAFDDQDARWRWVRSGLLLMLFGYFTLPLLVAGVIYAASVADEPLMKFTVIATLAAMVPIIVGWLLCALTPAEAGTSRKALMAAIGLIIQVWILAGKIWPDAVVVPEAFNTFRSFISVLTLALMLRYLQHTLEYLNPGGTGRWVVLMRRLTIGLALLVLAGILVLFLVPQNRIPPVVSVPFLVVFGGGALLLFLVFYGGLFRLWVLLRGEGQLGVSDPR